MFNDVITVYNKYKDGTTEKWKRLVLCGVLWDAIKGVTYRKTGASSVDSIQVIIPTSVIVDAEYVKPKAWAVLENKTGYWTLQNGDVVVKGDVSLEVLKSSAELNILDDCFTITSVDTKSFGGDMAHWEVSGK